VSGLALPSDDTGLLEQDGVTVHRGRIEDDSLLSTECSGSTHAVHCAALLPDAETLGREAFRAVNVRGAQKMCALAARQGWSRLVFLSTVGVLGREPSGPSTDHTAYREPFDNYTWSKIEAEKAIVAETEKLRIPSVILRPAHVYGEGMRFRWPEVFSLVESGTMRLIGDGNVPFSLIHVDDLVAAVLAALDEKKDIPPGERITVVSGEAITLRQVLEIIARKMGAPAPRSVPYPLALAAAIAIAPWPKALRIGPLRHLSVPQVRELRKGVHFDARHAREMLGFNARIAFAQGIDAPLREWRERSA
jgi:nucleoside-diphosphate-sugar epimerase